MLSPPGANDHRQHRSCWNLPCKLQPSTVRDHPLYAAVRQGLPTRRAAEQPVSHVMLPAKQGLRFLLAKEVEVEPQLTVPVIPLWGCR